METTEKNAVKAHVLKVCGFHPATPRYKLIERLFKEGELLFDDFDYERIVSLRKDLWFLRFECAMRWNKIIITEDAIFNYYVTVMGLTPEHRDPGIIFYE